MRNTVTHTRSHTKPFLVVLTFVIVSLIGCAPPIGIGGNSGADLMAVPQRMVYDVLDSFKRETDLSVFVGGQKISNDDVEIVILEDLDNLDYTSAVNGSYTFSTAGQKMVSVYYNDLSAAYSIDVRDPDAGDNDGGNVIIGPGNGGGPGLGGGGIIWVYDRVITSRNITITVPAAGETPQTEFINGQFTASVSWADLTNSVDPFSGVFVSGNQYRAVITVIPLKGYTLVGVRPGHFTVNGASPTTTNTLSSGFVEMLFTVP
ncbi:MAG: hypothetical protein LBV20_00035 [Treponema sp.]|nr:hypothetical protein [Treponema sp.]